MISNTPLVGFVILNYKIWEKTVSCVQSILDSYHDDKVIVIVDNKSPNESYDKLLELYSTDRYKEIKVIQTGRNGGFSYGNNYGFNYIKDTYPLVDKIVISNNDILFQAGAIKEMLDGFSISEQVVLTAPKIYDPQGNETNIPWKVKPNILQELYLADCTPCIFKWIELDDNVIAYMVSGCCFAVDKKLFDKIGKFDENVFLYNEENIISKKIADNHLIIVYCPNSKVIHDHGSTTGNQTIFVDKEYAKSSLYFFKEYEKLSTLQLKLIKVYFLFRITLKYISCRYSCKNGYWKGLKEIFLFH